jgi:hypothetical protein
MRRWPALLLLVCTAAQAVGPGQKLVFIGCPIIRDTHVPCWLAEYHGELYYLGAQGSALAAFYPPQFQHQALVEGVVSNQPRICGGIPLESLKVATLPEVDPRCNVMLPAEAYPDPPYTRGTGPAESQQPRRPTEPVVYSPPFGPKSFVVPFDFEMDHPWVGDTRIISDALAYAKASSAHQIKITGYRRYATLTDGGRLIESTDVVHMRADAITEAIQMIGSDTKVTTATDLKPRDPDSSVRGVVITVIP